MSQIVFDVTTNEEPRNRLTTAFRLILAIPHLILVSVWQYAVELVAVIQWFIILFTGKRNAGLSNFSNSSLGYATRVNSYTSLLFDDYPGSSPTGPVPVSTTRVRRTCRPPHQRVAVHLGHPLPLPHRHPRDRRLLRVPRCVVRDLVHRQDVGRDVRLRPQLQPLLRRDPGLRRLDDRHLSFVGWHTSPRPARPLQPRPRLRSPAGV